MSGDVCAVKRDVRRILETPYPVDLLQFKVDVISSNTPLLSTEQLYSIRQEGENYYLFHLLTQLDFYIKISSSIEFWREGMDVVILNKNAMKVGTGRLIHKGIDMDKALTKEEILASGCVIKSKYQTQFDNASNTQLIPEKYLLKPSDPPVSVTFYYDSRYLSITRLNLSIYEIEKVDGDYSNLSEREIDKQISPLNQKSSAKSYIVCQIGDILKVEEKENPDYEYGSLTIGGIWDYNSTSNVELIKSNKTSSLSFEITLDCFATFTIYSPKYKITASVPGVYTAPTEEGEIALLPDGYDFGFTLLADDESIPTYAKEGQEINLSMELANYPSDASQENLFYISPIVTVTYLENGVARAKHLSPGIFNATTTTSTCSFTMPAADCHITVKLKLIGDGADQFVEPTEGEAGYALVVTGNIGLVIIYGYYRTIPAMVIALDKVNVSFTRKLGYSYTYSLYYTASGTTLKSGVILGDCIEVDVWNDLTLNILELETDCIYTSATGKLALDKNWDNNNPIIGHNYYDNRSYAIDTENPLLTSGINNTFRNKSVTQVTFNSTNDLFRIYNNAFKDCNILTTVSVNGPTSISIGLSAFENTTSLQKINGSENIIRLSEKSFKNSGLLAYNSNIEITNIPKYTFLDCDRLSNVSLHNSPLSIINERAFEKCSNLKTISVPKCIKEIGVYSFGNSGIPAISTSTTPQLLAGCTFITDNGRTELSVIEEGVFKGCTNLKDIELPDSIEHLETLSFAECDNIQNFASPGLKTIALGAFKDTWVEKQQYFNQLKPNRPNYDNDSLRYKEGTSGVYFKFIDRLYLPLTHISLIKPNPEEESYILYNRKGLLAGAGNMYYIRENISSISDYGFAKNDVLDYADPYHLWFGEGNSQDLLRYPIKHIGDYAFKDSGVGILAFNGSELEYLGEGAFYNCHVLREIYGLEKATLLTEIKPKTFYNCGSNFSGIGATGDETTFVTPSNFYIPPNTKKIGAYAFAQCPQLMAILNHMLCPIEEIEEYAFYRCFRNAAIRSAKALEITLQVCTILLSLSLSACSLATGIGMATDTSIEGLVTIGNATLDSGAVASVYYWGCSSPTFISNMAAAAAGWFINSGLLLGVGAAALSELIMDAPKWRRKLKNTTELMFPVLKRLGKSSFEDCTYVSSIVLGPYLEEIPERCFYNCKRLALISFAPKSYDPRSNEMLVSDVGSVKKIGKEAFRKCESLSDAGLVALLNNAEEIEEKAFYDAEFNLIYGKWIVLPQSLKRLGQNSLGFKNSLYLIATQEIPQFTIDNRAFIDKNISGMDVHMQIPEGSRSKYEKLFKNEVVSIHYIEVPKDDPLWQNLARTGYDIPWVDINSSLYIPYINLGTDHANSWCTHNLLGSKSTDLGLTYQWGGYVALESNLETLPHEQYDEVLKKFIKYCSDDGMSFLLDEDDAARIVTNLGYRIPSVRNFELLIEKCTWVDVVQDGVKGVNIISSTGELIFLPTQGRYNADAEFDSSLPVYYWSNQKSESDDTKAYALDPVNRRICLIDRCEPAFIRPIFVG